jgi:hypothetical protein
VLPNGNGLQSVYLTEVPQILAETLVGLIGVEAEALVVRAGGIEPVPGDDLEVWEGAMEQDITRDSSIPETDRLGLLRALQIVSFFGFEPAYRKFILSLQMSKLDRGSYSSWRERRSSRPCKAKSIS